MKILGECKDSVNDMTGIEISEATSSLKAPLESALWKFADILVNAWLRGIVDIPSPTSVPRMIQSADVMTDVNVFYYLENWVGSTVDPYTTVYLSQMCMFQKQITTSAFKITGGVDLSSSSSSSSRSKTRRKIRLSTRLCRRSLRRSWTRSTLSWMGGCIWRRTSPHQRAPLPTRPCPRSRLHLWPRTQFRAQTRQNSSRARNL